jgi:hypothetical protein
MADLHLPGPEDEERYPEIDSAALRAAGVIT